VLVRAVIERVVFVLLRKTLFLVVVVVNIVCSSLRCAAYETLGMWMSNIGSSCGTEMFAGDIIQHCLADCSTSANSLKVSCLQL